MLAGLCCSFTNKLTCSIIKNSKKKAKLNAANLNFRYLVLQVLLLIDIQLSYINTNHEDFIGFAK